MNPSDLKKIIHDRPDITQKKIAEKLGVTESTLINYLRKDSFDEIPLGSIKKISEVTGIELDEFIDTKKMNIGLENTNSQFNNSNKSSNHFKSQGDFIAFLLNQIEELKRDKEFLKSQIVQKDDILVKQ